MSRNKVKNTRHSIIRARERTDLNKKQIKNLIREAQTAGIAAGNMRDGPIKTYLKSKGNHKRIKVYKDYVFVFNKTSTSCITMYPLKPELKEKQALYDKSVEEAKKLEYNKDKEIKAMDKFLPKVGDQLYLYQANSGGAIGAVKTPYTVIEVTKTKVTIQSANLIFYGPRYFDTLPDDIQEDPEGQIRELHWSNKYKRWQDTMHGTFKDYPQVAVFGKYEYYPYLD